MLNWNNYPNFTAQEFAHGGPEMHSEFMRKLQLARWICASLCLASDVPIIIFEITSGSRSEERNRQVGGKPDSTHLYGRACDIKASSSRSRYYIVKSLMLAGFTRIGISASEYFIHVDDGELITNETGHPKTADVLWVY